MKGFIDLPDTEGREHRVRVDQILRYRDRGSCNPHQTVYLMDGAHIPTTLTRAILEDRMRLATLERSP